MKKFKPFSILSIGSFLLSFSASQAADDLIISEMHYNPSGTDNGEFIEIQNVSDAPIDMSGYKFTRGITYTFPNPSVLGSGAYYVLVTPSSNLSGVAIKGVYADDDLPASYPGALDGAGERVTLEDASGSNVIDFTYDDKKPWPELPDGNGYSLVAYRTDGEGDPDTPGYWIPSINIGGSPGQPEPNAGVSPIYINEIRTRDGALSNDTIELYNPNSIPVNIGNWYLSDSTADNVGQDGRKGYRIPANTEIAAHSFLQYSETSLGFGLSSQGNESVYLWSGNASGNLTGYAHGFVFEASGDGLTFGRHINSDGVEQFVAQDSVTLGNTNSAPRVDDVVITEIMYNPLNGIEYVEIRNTGTSTVNLFDPANPTISWTLDGFGFTFPASQPTIGPNEIILVVNTNEAIFRANYDVPAVTVYDTATGSLNNSSERIALQRPENLDILAIPAVYSYITVDAVKYDDGGSWPSSPDGGGNSLVRRVAKNYGNESSNWRASLETGGSPGWSTEYTGLEVYVNEALTHTDLPRVDAIELYNPNGVIMDISGWYLTDNKDIPRKFKIPPGNNIGINGYWALNEDNDGNPDNNASLPSGYFGKAFSLGSRGDSVYLFSATPDGRLSGYSHGFSFNASANGVSFGRLIDADGEEHFVAQQSVTIQLNIATAYPLGMANAPPLIGDVVINEFFYDTKTNQVEFIELINRTGSTVNLYDDSPIGNTANNWGVTNGVSMIFPGSLPTLASGEMIIILPLGTDAASFRSSNSVPASVAIYGGADGFEGSLRNGGERITLMRPDKPDEVPLGSGNLVIPWIDVDSIEYDDDAPWPYVGTTGGRSIERINPAAFGDESPNWRTSNSLGGTPGGATSVGTVYGLWALEQFTEAEREVPNTTGPEDDFNADGIKNARSYVAGLDPRVATTLESLGSLAIMNSGGEDYLVLQHLRRNDGSDIVWTAERTSNLITGPWEAANTSAIPPLANGGGNSTWFARDTLPMADRTRSYVHVSFELTE